MTRTKPRTVTRDAAVYLTQDGEFIVERADGSGSVALTSADVLRLIRSDDLKIAKRQKAIVITRVTWHPAYVTTDARTTEDK